MSLRIAILLLISVTISCSKTEQQPTKKHASHHPVEAEKIVRIETFKIDNGWGYDIYLNNEKYIHQQYIPSVNGMHTFVSEAEAYRVAELVVEKINNNLMPPTISIDELNYLNIVVQ
ncbi:MAG: DUF4907 domain-containing protein [Bacteroidetes bacterium]|nr:DUF4907 domain-containing protein [Bacteroidota bacterium]